MTEMMLITITIPCKHVIEGHRHIAAKDNINPREHGHAYDRSR
ncbi:MAG: hypothetical protein ACOX4J_04615 [Anaerovoracaceae bacterium]